jgi:hypothetical protein
MMTSRFGDPKTKAEGTPIPSALENVELNYAPLVRLAQANTNGQRIGTAALDQVFGDLDCLYLPIKQAIPDSCDTETLATLRGFMRVLQKRIERGNV